MIENFITFIVFIGEIIFFILGAIFIIFTIFILYDGVLNTFKYKKIKNKDIKIKDIINDIELELNINEVIIDWKIFQKFIFILEKKEVGSFFNESYEIDNLLFKYNYISLVTIRLFSEILVGTNFVGNLKDEDISKIKKIFKESKTEEYFINNLRKNKKIWEFIKNNIVFKN